MSERCKVCDRPVATDADWQAGEEDRLYEPNGAPSKPSESICWGDSQCRHGEVDWRTRALRAEALLGCAAEIGRVLHAQWAAWNAIDADAGGIDLEARAPRSTRGGALRLLATDPAELMRLVPETAPIIERALSEAGVGLEEQC